MQIDKITREEMAQVLGESEFNYPLEGHEFFLGEATAANFMISTLTSTQDPRHAYYVLTSCLIAAHEKANALHRSETGFFPGLLDEDRAKLVQEFGQVMEVGLPDAEPCNFYVGCFLSFMGILSLDALSQEALIGVTEGRRWLALCRITGKEPYPCELPGLPDIDLADPA